ncbi:hypothetical protein CPLU01_03352 [Colletotrichum plurivorum]|uniref:Uncharacterized protein n=1 Tax=Colletotrichum plurivorum TaxID=2175906 RepID=A0A8H6NLA7_9PEZI|nr:hypothetical protein CPLU01_03352 [Colletotrichum plurivorum]
MTNLNLQGSNPLHFQQPLESQELGRCSIPEHWAGSRVRVLRPASLLRLVTQPHSSWSPWRHTNILSPTELHGSSRQLADRIAIGHCRNDDDKTIPSRGNHSRKRCTRFAANNKGGKDNYHPTSSSPILPLSYSSPLLLSPVIGIRQHGGVQDIFVFPSSPQRDWQQQLVVVACLDQNDLKVKKDVTKLPLIFSPSNVALKFRFDTSVESGNGIS